MNKSRRILATVAFSAAAVSVLMLVLATVGTASTSKYARLSAPSGNPKYCPKLPTDVPTDFLKTHEPVWVNMEIRTSKGEVVPEVAFSVRNYVPRTSNYSYVGQGVWSGCWEVAFYKPGHAPDQLCISLHLGVTATDGKNCLPVTKGPSGYEVRYELLSPTNDPPQVSAPVATTGG